MTCNRYQFEASHHLLATLNINFFCNRIQALLQWWDKCCWGLTCTIYCPCAMYISSITEFVAILESQLATATLNDSFMKAVVSRGCPQAGVLSPLLWCLVADDMIERVNKGCCIYSGYADDTCLWEVGKFPNMVSKLMQLALHTVETHIYKRKLPMSLNLFSLELSCTVLCWSSILD